MFELELLTFKLLFIPLSVFDSNLLKSVIITLVIFKLLLIEVNDFIASHIQELSSMRDDNYNVLAVCNIVFEPHDCIQV